MEEADVDELEWMACQLMPDQETEFYDLDEHDFQRSPPHPPATESHAADESSRKRILPDANQSAAKRARDISHGPSPSEVGRTRPSSTSLTSRSNLHGNPTEDASAVEAVGLPKAFRNADHLPFRIVSEIGDDFMPITGPDGVRVYAKLSRTVPTGINSHYTNSMLHVSTAKGLLLQPIEAMVEQAEQERLEKMFADGMAGDSHQEIASHGGAAQEQLWVDKYSPKSFTDLLSDEQTNRQVLRWLRQWDSFAFVPKKNSFTTEEVLVALRQKLPSTEGRSSYHMYRQDRFSSTRITRDGPFNKRSTTITSQTETKFQRFASQIDTENTEKVLLLCGPPGLGKTTLAHIAAKHCGYHIVEINASDDRVAATLKLKILNAVQMKSVTGDCRPNCLIIDEIDGAVGGVEGRSAIKHLVDIITATKKKAAIEESHSQDGSVPSVTKRKNAKASHSLERPIICICNDLYAPALRPLRQVARVYKFSRPSASRVVTRLKDICKEEGFKTDTRALTALADHAESDIRACLNTLQFLKRKGQPLTSVDVGSQVIGSKDITRSVYEIWAEVFRKIETPSRLLVHQTKTRCRSQQQLEFSRLYDLIDNHGDHELALSGIHENLLQTGYQDSYLSKTVECMQSICDSDIRTKQVHSKQCYYLNGYQPTTLITIRSLVATPMRPNIQWPRTFQRYSAELAKRKELLSMWLSRMSPGISRGLSITTLTLNVVSPLLTIISPSLRPVASQLHTLVEKKTMKELVDTMACFGLTYKQDNVEDPGVHETGSNRQGPSAVVLDPPINCVIAFEGHTVKHRQLSTTLRQMLGHEIELERIRRESAALVKADQGVAQELFSTEMKLVACSSLSNTEHKKQHSGRQEQAPGEIAKALPSGMPDVAKDDASAFPLKPKQMLTSGYQSSNFFDRDSPMQFVDPCLYGSFCETTTLNCYTCLLGV